MSLVLRAGCWRGALRKPVCGPCGRIPGWQTPCAHEIFQPSSLPASSNRPQETERRVWNVAIDRRTWDFRQFANGMDAASMGTSDIRFPL
jgi:hypothetical protein